MTFRPALAGILIQSIPTRVVAETVGHDVFSHKYRKYSTLRVVIQRYVIERRIQVDPLNPTLKTYNNSVDFPS